MLVLDYVITDEVFRFVLSHLNRKVTYNIAESTSLKIDDMVYFGDQLLLKLIELFQSTGRLNTIKTALKNIDSQSTEDTLLNLIRYYNMLKETISKGTLKYYDVLVQKKQYVNIDFEFYLLEIIAGTIQSIEPLEGMDNIFIENVNIGTETRIICSGLRKYYHENDLNAKTALFIINLKPGKFKNALSHGMICCGSFEEIIEVIFVDTEDSGSRLSLGDTHIYFSHIQRGEIPLLKKEKYLNALQQFTIREGCLYFKNTKCFINGKEVKLNRIITGTMK